MNKVKMVEKVLQIRKKKIKSLKISIEIIPDVFNDRDRGTPGSVPLQVLDQDLPLQQGLRPRGLPLQVTISPPSFHDPTILER